MRLEETSIANAAATSGEESVKPRLLFFRGRYDLRNVHSHDNLPSFIRSHLQQHIKCLSIFFDVNVVSEDGNYGEMCERYKPDITLVESGVYGGPPRITNTSACPEIPKIGFLNADAYCVSRRAFLSDMERWGIGTFFSISVSMPEYMPTVADKLFVWPNFIDPGIFRDYAQPKSIPVLITGSQAIHYPWRNRITRIIAQQFPSLTCPHLGWFDANAASRMVYNEEYARMINSSCVVPTCGTIAKEVVRKHFEIPGCRSCLLTERTPALEAAGFVDMENCVFATEADVLDKLEHLFKNRDVMESISRAGHRLVHSQHTLRQRNQVFQWLTLNKCLQPNQRIIQTQPFGPLTIVDSRSWHGDVCSITGGVDRAILRNGDTQLRLGNYDKAEWYYLRCLNYHGMPEPMLGLALCNLYKGDPDGALRRILESLRQAVEIAQGTHPDPVEWAYFIISLLCRGDVKEATRRAHQFPALHHQELDRCRWLIGKLNGFAYADSEQGRQHVGAAPRPSIHQLPQRDLAAWVAEVCTMLAACQQARLAEQLNGTIRGPVTQTYGGEQAGRARPSNSLKTATGKFIDLFFPTEVFGAKPSATRRRSSTFRFMNLRELKLRYKQAMIAPLNAGSFLDKVLRWVLPALRQFAAFRRSLMPREDEFASVVRAWAAREDSACTALVLGACDRSAYTSAFLEGLQTNPSLPIAFCVGSSTTEFRNLKKQFADHPRIKFCSGAVIAARNENGRSRFDLVLVDQYVSGEEEAFAALRDSKTVLIGNIDTYLGYKIANNLLSGKEYGLAYENVSELARSAILTKTHCGIAALAPTEDDGGRTATREISLRSTMRAPQS